MFLHFQPFSSDACPLLIGPDLSQSAIGAGGIHFLGDGDRSLVLLVSFDTDNSSLDVLDQVVGIFQSITDASLDSLLWLSFILGQDNQFLKISFETVHISLKRFGGLIGPSVVNADSDSFSEVLIEASLFDFFQGETSAETGPSVVSLSRTSDGGSQVLKRTRSDGLGLLSTVIESPSLSAGLIEPGLHPSLPVLPEMILLDRVVMLGHSLYYFIPVYIRTLVM